MRRSKRIIAPRLQIWAPHSPKSCQKNTFGDLRAISDNYAAQRPVNSQGNPKLNDAIDGDVNLDVAHAAVRVHAARVSWNLFTVLVTPAALGRTFLPGEDALNSDQVVVISYGLWQQLFGGDRSAVGSSIRVNGAPLTIIGVTPSGFDYPRDTVLWQPANRSIFSEGNNG